MQTALAGASVSMNPARSGAGEHIAVYAHI